LTNVVGLCAGSAHSVALKSDGRVVAWGNNSSGQTNVPAGATNVVAIAAALNHTLAKARSVKKQFPIRNWIRDVGGWGFGTNTVWNNLSTSIPGNGQTNTMFDVAGDPNSFYRAPSIQ
jgi:hypothetical protein